MDTAFEKSKQFEGLIKALEHRLETIQHDICPAGTNLSHFFNQQQKEAFLIREQIQALKADIASSTKIPSHPSQSTFSQMLLTPQIPTPSTYSGTQMIASQTISPKPQPFDIAQFV